jgi:hypothetical protein
MSAPGRSLRAAASLVVAAVLVAGGCSEDCCTIDSFPIGIARAPLGGPGAGAGAASGGFLATATAPSVAGGAPFPMLVDTGSPVTILDESGNAPRGGLAVERRAFDLLDALAAAPAPVRARFRDVAVLDLPLTTVGDAATAPLGVVGADLLRAFSVDMRFGAACPGADGGATSGLCSYLTFWHHQGADLGFLQNAGYAVITFTPFGGGEVTVTSEPDLVGLTGPLSIPATRTVLRACMAPAPFDPATATREQCCTRGAEVPIVTGIDMSLMVATGVGPLVLGQSAWTRLAATLPAPPAMTPGPLNIATWPTPIDAQWTTIPRFALVNLEAGSAADPGPCIELGRARRIEWVSWQTVNNPTADICFQPCDTDPREPDLAQNSAAYIDLGGAIPVAVIADEEGWLQGLRFDVRPEGPEVDGVLGAAALGSSRVEINYLSSPAAALFSCEGGVPRASCFAAARCPRLPDQTQTHSCFGLPPHTLPSICGPDGC